MTVTGADVVTEAEKFLGDPYVYGDAGPSEFDCSGLVYYVYKQLGITVPRTSEEQYTAGTPITEDQLKPGDLVFAAGSDGTPGSPGHVGIYVGDTGQSTTTHADVPVAMVLEAPHTGEDVKYTPLSDFQAVGYRSIAGVNTSDTSQLGTQAAGTGLGGLLNIPSEITGFFTGATDDLTATANWFAAFTRPSTYVRAGSGILGAVFLVAGLVFLIMEARSSG